MQLVWKDQYLTQIESIVGRILHLRVSRAGPCKADTTDYVKPVVNLIDKHHRSIRRGEAVRNLITLLKAHSDEDMLFDGWETTIWHLSGKYLIGEN